MNTSHTGSASGPYSILPKVGTRGKQWLVVNRHGGLVEEVDGRAAARKRANRLNDALTDEQVSK